MKKSMDAKVRWASGKHNMELELSPLQWEIHLQTGIFFFVFLISVTQCTSGYRSQTGYKTRSINNGPGGFTCFPGTWRIWHVKDDFFFRENQACESTCYGNSSRGCWGFKNWMLGDVGEVHWSEIFLINHEFFHEKKTVQWKMSILERNNNTWFGAIFHWTRICRDRGVLNEIGIYDLRF